MTSYCQSSPGSFIELQKTRFNVFLNFKIYVFTAMIESAQDTTVRRM